MKEVPEVRKQDNMPGGPASSFQEAKAGVFAFFFQSLKTFY